MKEPELHELLRCEGYYGFGGGWAMASGRTTDEGEVLCGVCPVREKCWETHKARVTRLAPDVVASFEELVEECEGNGQVAVQLWFKAHRTPDPYSMVMSGNIEDGLRVAQGHGPADREDCTLPWPLP